MKELKELKEMVEELNTISNVDDIAKQIRKILVYVIRNFDIQCGNIKIEPLMLEAYFQKDDVFVEVSNNNRRICHCDEFQRNNFATKLHYHKDNKKCRVNGIDLCLSTCEDFYFSLLIKVSRIDNKIYKQRETRIQLEIYKNENINNNSCILVKKQKPVDSIEFANRINIISNLNVDPLAVLIEPDTCIEQYPNITIRR